MPDIVETLVQRFEALADAWKADVAEMRKKSAINPPADTLAYAASELLERVREARLRVAQLGVEEWATLHHVSAQSVRRWCADGTLPAERGPDGEWRIASNATRRRKSA